MTIEEMKDEIKKECNRHSPLCYDNGCCPLYQITKSDCYDCDTDEEVIEHYKLIYPDNTVNSEEAVNHPSHYNQGGMECIDEMVLIFGTEATMNFCLCNAWKYRYRANAKNGQEDLDKANWYIAKYKELKEELTGE